MSVSTTFSWQTQLFSPTNLTHNVSLHLNFNGTEIKNNRFLSGTLQREWLTKIDLLNQALLDAECPSPNHHAFTQCTRNHSKVWVRRGYSLAPHQKLGGDLHMNEFVPHLIAVNNALLNRDGAIFDAQRLYVRGGCADFAWHTWEFIYDSKMTRMVSYDEPIIALTQPYETAFAHELLDVYSNLIALRPVLHAYPHIKILVRARLGHAKYFPLLRAYGIDPAKLNFIVHLAEQRLVHAPYIIAPLNYACNVISRHVAHQVHQAVATLANRSASPLPQILFHDRKYEETRRLLAGDDVFRLLVSEYGRDEGPDESTVKGKGAGVGAGGDVSASVSTGTATIRASFVVANSAISGGGTGGADSNRSLVGTSTPVAPTSPLPSTHPPTRTVKKRFNIVRYYGNESFEETVAKFSTSAYVVAAHGAGLVNMVFMHPGTTVIEVRPMNFEVPVFDRSAESLGVNHRVLRTGTGRWRGPLKIDARSLLAFVREVVDNGTSATVYAPGTGAGAGTGTGTGGAAAAAAAAVGAGAGAAGTGTIGAATGAGASSAGAAGFAAPATGP